MFKRKSKKAQGLCSICITREGASVAYATDSPSFVLQHSEFIEADSLEALTPKLAAFVEQHKLTGMDTALVLRASEYRLFFLDAPNVPEAERPQAAKFLVKDLIDYPMDEAAIDVFEVPNRAGNPAKVYVVAMKLARAIALSEIMSVIGLNMVSMSVSELAINSLASHIPESKEGVAFLYKDSQSLHVLITKGGILRIIRDVGPVSRIENLDQIDRLVLEIQRSIDFYQSQLGHQAPSKLFVTPRIGQHVEAIELMKAQLTLPIEPFDIDQCVPHFGELNDQQKKMCLPVIGELNRLLVDVPAAETEEVA